jgi:hypothetical protein
MTDKAFGYTDHITPVINIDGIVSAHEFSEKITLAQVNPLPLLKILHFHNGVVL